MAHVAAWKKDMVSELVQDMREYPVVAVVDMEGIPGQQVQSMRAGLRAHAKLKMTKNNLMLLAIEEAARTSPRSSDSKTRFTDSVRSSPRTSTPSSSSRSSRRR